jgi:hypothetical protein
VTNRSIVFGSDRGVVVFLAFLVLAIVVAPTIKLSQAEQLALSFTFSLLLISGAFATIQHRCLSYIVAGLTILTLSLDLIGEFTPLRSYATLETSLRVACLLILVFMTLKRTLRPGPVTVYRVLGGIAGYLLIGYVWTFAYQLVVEYAPDAIHIGGRTAEVLSRQPSQLIYFSFITLTTVGYGDTYPVHPVVRSLAVAEALVGQLYLAILIGSLVGMALQTKIARES